MVGLGRFMVSLGQFKSLWVGSWSVCISLGRFMVGLIRFIVSLDRFGSVHHRLDRSMVSLGQFGSVHGQFGSV